uniref:Protein CgeD n=1 Tax=Lygus hesperus TaxID=30085 RepID=A0A0A9W475_LYGHE
MITFVGTAKRMKTSKRGDLLVPDYLMTAITTGDFNQKPPSYDELAYRTEQELEAVVQTFGYEPSEDVTWDTQSTLDFKEALNYTAFPFKPPTAIVEEECADMDESTKNKINGVLNLIHEKPELMMGYITF